MKNIDTIAEKIQYKIKNESPFIFEKCSDEEKNNIIETFYKIVIDEMELNLMREKLDINTLNNIKTEFKPISPTFDSITSERVYKYVPELTYDFIIKKIKSLVNQEVL